MPLDAARHFDVRDLRRLLVLRNQLDQRLTIRSTYQLEKLRVLLADPREQVRVGDRVGLDRVRLEGELRDGLGQWPVAARFEERLMEDEVQPEDVAQATGLDRRAVLRVHALRAFRPLRVRPVAASPRPRPAREARARSRSARLRTIVKSRTTAPRLGRRVTMPISLQLDEYLADHVPLDVESGEQIVLDEALARPKKAECDLLLETLDDVGQAGRLGPSGRLPPCSAIRNVACAPRHPAHGCRGGLPRSRVRRDTRVPSGSAIMASRLPKLEHLCPDARTGSARTIARALRDGNASFGWTHRRTTFPSSRRRRKNCSMKPM